MDGRTVRRGSAPGSGSKGTSSSRVSSTLPSPTISNIHIHRRRDLRCPHVISRSHAQPSLAANLSPFVHLRVNLPRLPLPQRLPIARHPSPRNRLRRSPSSKPVAFPLELGQVGLVVQAMKFSTSLVLKPSPSRTFSLLRTALHASRHMYFRSLTISLTLVPFAPIVSLLRMY
jgi:hypothetical protein